MVQEEHFENLRTSVPKLIFLTYLNLALHGPFLNPQIMVDLMVMLLFMVIHMVLVLHEMKVFLLLPLLQEFSKPPQARISHCLACIFPPSDVILPLPAPQYNP
ncbi:hypothetical protein VNO77_25846 [Canavalia gladiata]|uniref:Uncharacterized protein n=1 Tax=Canavalia gladiata TaxID=3824 RepID=A0AAN9KRA7_CANGL